MTKKGACGSSVDGPPAYGHWINDQWSDIDRSSCFDDMNPLDDSVVAKFAIGTPHDIDRAVAAADSAFVRHRDAGPSARESWLIRSAEILQRRSDELVDLLIDETGSSISKAKREVATATNVLRAAAGVTRQMRGDCLASDQPGRLSLAVREPLGVVAGITPFNVPLIKAVKHSALPIAVGNSVVMLPSAEAPLMAAKLSEIYHEAGLPGGLFNVVFGHGADIGDSLTGHHLVKMIGFTGSTRTGRHVAQVAAQSGKRVTLEMGGKNAVVVMDDANLAQAIPAITIGAFLFQGQICMSTSRVYVQRSNFDVVCERLVAAAKGLPAGDLRDSSTMLGPMIHARQRSRVVDHLDDAIGQGATVLCGGSWSGRCLAPTILTDVTKDMRVANEETFGPVLTVTPVDDLDQAITQVNATPFGLVAAIFTQHQANALRFTRECNAGMVHVNGPTIQEEAHVPFGGNGDSGFGREGAIVGIDELTRWKWITLA